MFGLRKQLKKIGEWRAYFRSTYVRWALALNGLHVAKDRYYSKKADTVGFSIESLRQSGLESIAFWDMETAAKNHE